MIFRIVLTAVIAGLVAGLLVTALQAARTVPLILEAETYEQAAPATTDHRAAAPHAHEAWAPADGWERTGFTFIANFLTATGFAALLASAFTLYGRPVSPGGSIVWGLSGFAAFSFIPSIGLPPELPGMIAGDLAARQFWWWSSVVANCVGLGVLFFTPRPLWKALGGVLILVPFVVGAPHADSGAGSVPPELAAQFATATLGTSLLFWIALGLCAGFVFNRLAPARVEEPARAPTGA